MDLVSLIKHEDVANANTDIVAMNMITFLPKLSAAFFHTVGIVHAYDAGCYVYILNPYEGHGRMHQLKVRMCACLAAG